MISALQLHNKSCFITLVDVETRRQRSYLGRLYLSEYRGRFVWQPTGERSRFTLEFPISREGVLRRVVRRVSTFCVPVRVGDRGRIRQLHST